jgi:hypothetical protein
MTLRTVAPLAATLGVLAGGSFATAAEPPAKMPAVKTTEVVAPGNQALADTINQKLTATGAAFNADVTMTCVDGVVTLSGACKDADTKAKILQDVRTVNGVTKVRDGLTVGSTQGIQRVQGVTPQTLPPAVSPGAGAPPAVSPGSNLPPAVSPGPRMGPTAMPPMTGTPPAMNYGQPSPAMPGYPMQGYGAPSYGNGPMVEPMPMGQGGGHADHGAPPMPPYAWPTYAPYNNVSRVAYPEAYPYNAFPFIGPYYPFPKVPLGWRKVTLEWEDGYWWYGKQSTPNDYWRVRFW